MSFFGQRPAFFGQPFMDLCFATSARKSPEIGGMTTRPEDLSDEHINQINRFLRLPQEDATELNRWRGFLRWMRGRFAPDPRPSNDKPPRS
jgi:hypothetical protein